MRWDAIFRPASVLFVAWIVRADRRRLITSRGSVPHEPLFIKRGGVLWIRDQIRWHRDQLSRDGFLLAIFFSSGVADPERSAARWSVFGVRCATNTALCFSDAGRSARFLQAPKRSLVPIPTLDGGRRRADAARWHTSRNLSSWVSCSELFHRRVGKDQQGVCRGECDFGVGKKPLRCRLQLRFPDRLRAARRGGAKAK